MSWICGSNASYAGTNSSTTTSTFSANTTASSSAGSSASSDSRFTISCSRQTRDSNIGESYNKKYQEIITLILHYK